MSEVNFQPIPPLSSFDGFEFPIKNNRYEIAAGLTKINDEQIFIRNEYYPHYQKEKETCLYDNKDKYYCTLNGYEKEISTIAQFLGPKDFHQNCMALQEDVAIVKNGLNIAIHLAYPNHWDPRDKIGQDFYQTHFPVADFGPVKKSAPALLKACLTQGPFERYAWGLSSDTRLNHHPEAPMNIADHSWYGRTNKDKLYMRVERQTIKGFPQIDSFLFTIFTFFIAVDDLTAKQYESLIKAVDSMTDETLSYKGIDREKVFSYRKDLND